MDSVPSAEVAVQALLDPMPGALIARHAPSPRDIIWANTYLSRTSRSIRGWTISISVTLLSIFWLIPVAALAVLWNLSEIKKYAPAFGEFLDNHDALSSLVQTTLPTLILTLLNVSIPYLYDCMMPASLDSVAKTDAVMQGYPSTRDCCLKPISSFP
jgi:hypothetical protein